MSQSNSDNTTATRRHLSAWHWLLLALLAIGAALILRQSYTAPYHTTEGKAFNTTFTVKYKWADQLDNEILSCLKSIDGSLSMFSDSSLIARINRGETDEVDATFIEVYNIARQVSDNTDGYFDVTVKPLVDAWGFGTKEKHFPEQDEIDSLLVITGYKKLSLSGHRLVKVEPRITIDFSGVAKGYACDMVARMLKNLGVTDYMVEIGGEIACHGKGKDNDGWLIGITKPAEDSLAASHGIQTRLLLNERCIATSGNYYRFYYKNGRKVAHTINPHTGQPVIHTLLSATVIASSTAKADAYATAFMAAGVDSTKLLMSRDKSIDVYMIYADDGGKLHTWISDGFRKHIYNE